MKNRPKFFTSIQIRFSDTDSNGHVFFGNYLTYFDIALLELIKAVNYDFNRFRENELNFYYAEALTRFKASAFFDEILNVHAEISRFGNTSFTINFLVFEQKSDRFICSGHIVAVVVDLKTYKPVSVPQEFKDAIKAFGS